EIVAAAGLGRASCESVTRDQAKRLLHAAQKSAREVNPDRLGAVGRDAFPGAYACAKGAVGSIPYVVEVWANNTQKKTILRSYCVNRTPVTGSINAARDKRDICVFGCGLRRTIAQAPKDAHFDIQLNITTPYMPIMSDGKAPDLQPFVDAIA